MKRLYQNDSIMTEGLPMIGAVRSLFRLLCLGALLGIAVIGVSMSWSLMDINTAFAASRSGSDGTPDDDIEDRIEDDVSSRIEDDLEGQVEEQLEGNVENKVADEVEGDVEEEVEAKIEDRVDTRAQDDAAEALESRMEDRLEEQARIAEDLAEEAAERAEEAAEEAEDAAEEAAERAEDEPEDLARRARKNDDDDDDNDDDDDHRGKSHGNPSAKARSFDIDIDLAGNPISRNEWLVLIEPNSASALSEQDFQVQTVDSLSALGLMLARLRAPENLSINEAEAAIRAAAPEAEIDYNHLYFSNNADKPADGGVPVMAGFAPAALMAMPAAAASAPILIGIIDSAVDVTHPALSGTWLSVADFVPYANPRPSDHGTAIASILAGQAPLVGGLLPDARVYAASVFFLAQDGAATATTESLVRAIDWLRQQDVRIINMSLTGPKNAILEAAIQQAHRQGTQIVAAVGNGGPAAAPLYPAAYEQVVGVTAVTADKRIYRLANRGDHVDFAAPGVDISHAAPGNNVTASSGTSMAAPFVSAILAILCADQTQPCAAHIADLAAKAEDLGDPGFDPVFGHGLIRPSSALQP